MTDKPADYAIRQRALDVETSFAVAAPAGSGKTGLLTLRLLKLLCRSNKPEDILCITFTRKAASEMRERLLAALAQAKGPLPADAGEHAQLTHALAQQVLQRDAELGWQLEAAPGRLRIQTIDSFCRSLAGQLPIASALGSELATLENPDNAYRAAVAQLLQSYAECSDDEAQADLEVLIRHLDNQLNRLETLLVSLLANRDQWMSLIYQLKFGQRETLENALRRWGMETVDKVRAELAPFAGAIRESLAYAATNLTASNPEHPLIKLQDLKYLPGSDDQEIFDCWRPLIDLLLTAQGTWRKRLDKNCGFPPGNSKDEKARAKAEKDKFMQLLGELQSCPSLLANLQELRCFPGSCYTDEQWALLNSLTSVLPRLVAELKLVFRQLAATDFVEITEAALAALGSPEAPSELALKLDYQIQHILVDEFQDTATPQLTLLEKLTEGWQPGDGRTLFVVGDGMQSCYGFRDANVGLFLDIRDRGLPAVPVEALDLQVNFRSRRGIINWVNTVFCEAFPARDDIGRGAVRYSPSQAFDARPESSCVTCVGFPDQEDHQLEATYIASQIAQLRQQRPDDSIAVLVRGRSHLLEIVPALAARGIAYKAVDIDPLLARMAIVDLLSLTRALLDPSDRIAWLSVLRAPWCGLDMHDLHALVNAELGELNAAPRFKGFADLSGQLRHFDAISQLSPVGKTALERLRQAMEISFAMRRRKPLRQWVEGAWVALGGPAAVTSEAGQQDVQTFFSLLEKHDNAGTIGDWREFEEALAKLYAQPSSSPGDTPVELMTIHKSKGLEFDHVFLPGLERRTRGDDSALLLWHQRLNSQHEKELVLSPITAAEYEQKAPLYEFLQREKKIKERLEETRLLYVACTRARKELWLTANVQRDSNGSIKAPGDSCLLSRIWSGVADQLELVEATPELQTPSRDQAEERAAAVPIRRLSASWQLPEPVFEAPLAAYRADEYDNTALASADTDSFTNRAARHRGTFWHRIFRRLALDGLDHWSADRVQRQMPFWRAQAIQLGIAAGAVDALLEEIASTIARLRQDETGRWVFNPQHTDSRCEYPLISRDGKCQWIIDRTFISDGTRWIIDFKTSEPAPQQSLDQFLKQELASYTPQLKGYSRLFSQLETLPQSVALYFPLIQHLEPLDISREATVDSRADSTADITSEL